MTICSRMADRPETHYRMKATKLLFAGVTYALIHVACGGEVEIGQGQSRLTGASNEPNPDPAGHCKDSKCAPAQAGDCPMAKCADMGFGCSVPGGSSVSHLRCVPSPYAGQGSAPADMCELVGDCDYSKVPTDRPCDPSSCRAQPTCVYGTPTVGGCYDVAPEGKEASCIWRYSCQ
jgi:hypothetical protein